jgi:hypothetical protein
MNTTSNSWWIGPLVLTLIQILQTEARLSHAKAAHGAVVFRAALSVRLLFLIGIIGLTALTLASIGREESWLLATAAGFVILVCFGWPATIALDQNAIRRTVWWKPSVVILWSEVSGIEKNSAGDIQVFGNQGRSVTFTRFHIDPWRFQDEVRRRAGLTTITNASDLPTLKW